MQDSSKLVSQSQPKSFEAPSKQRRTNNIPRSFSFRRELRLDRVDAVIRSVSNAYRTFEYYQEHKEEIERHTLTDFAESATSHGDGSIRTSLEEMHALVVPRGGVLGGGRGVFEMLSEGLRVSECVRDLGGGIVWTLRNGYHPEMRLLSHNRCLLYSTV